MSYWIFKCNPARFRLSAYLAKSYETIGWYVAQHVNEIGPGDTAFMWQTGKDRGIVGVMRVNDTPHDLTDSENEKQFSLVGDTGVFCGITATITHRDLKLGHNKLRLIPGLENLSVFRNSSHREFPKGTNFRVTPEEGKILLKVIDDAKSIV